MDLIEHAETLYRAETADGNPIQDGIVDPDDGDRLIAVEAVPLSISQGTVSDRAEQLDRMTARLRDKPWIISALGGGIDERKRLACAELLDAAGGDRP